MKLSSFVQKQWSTAFPDVPLKWGWAPEAICDHLQAVTDGRIKNLVINVPPGFGVSRLAGTFWPAWEWHSEGRLSSRFATVAYSQPLAANVLGPLGRTHIALDGAAAPSVARVRLQNGIGGSMAAFGIGSAVCGDRFDRLVLDTANSPISSPMMLERDWDVFQHVWHCRVPPSGSIVVAQSRIGDGDLTDRILSGTMPGVTWPAEFTHLMIPMEFDDERTAASPIGWQDPRSRNGELAWPERFDHEYVEMLKKTVGRGVFDRRYQQLGLPLINK